MPEIRELISQWPKGTVYTLTALKKKGYYMQLMERYRKGKWIEPVGFGAYKLYGDKIDWYGGLYALQKQLRLNIYPGGKTALELQGYAHYVSEEMHQCYLYGEKGAWLPKWFKNYNWDVNILFKTIQLFSSNPETGLTDYAHKAFSIRISAAECAIMEMLYRVPSEHGFDESYRIMENLTTLRPEVVQEHLKVCRSVKVKRLFMFMAEHAGHAWVERLDKTRLNFGSGNRQLVKNGVLDKEYRITVPKEFAE